MLRMVLHATRVLCCALLALAYAPVAGAQDDEDEEVEDESCVEQPLGWLGRHALIEHLADVFPWITQPIVEETLVACADDPDSAVQVSFEPHLTGPGWDRSWTLACERIGTLSWSCEFPEEETFVYLSEGDTGVPIGSDVSPRDALEALATIVILSAGPGIPDPFEAGEPFRDLTADSALEVSRAEFCRGLFVPVQLDDEEPKHQFCVEREACGAKSGKCPLTVRVEGTTF